MSEHDFDGDDDIFSKSGRFGGNAEKRKDPAKPGGFGKSGNAGKPKDSTASSAGEGDAEAMRHLEHEFAAIDRESHRTVAVVFAAIAAVVALIFFGLQIRDKTTLLITRRSATCRSVNIRCDSRPQASRSARRAHGITPASTRFSATTPPAAASSAAHGAVSTRGIAIMRWSRPAASSRATAGATS